jgi:hypothetical protein
MLIKQVSVSVPFIWLGLKMKGHLGCGSTGVLKMHTNRFSFVAIITNAKCGTCSQLYVISLKVHQILNPDTSVC